MSNSIFEHDVEVLLKEYELEIMKIDAAYMTESKLFEMKGFTYMESSDDTQKYVETRSTTSIIDKIVDAISRVISGFIEMINNIFSKNENVTADDYINSNSGQVTLNHDVNKINEDVSRELLKGRKMVQAISNGTHIPDTTVANFVDSGANFLNKYGKIILATGATLAVKKSIVNSMKKNKDTVDATSKDAKKGKNDEKANRQKISILKRMSNLVDQSIKASSEVTAVISKNMKRMGD